MNKLYITCGPAYSGKSTVSKEIARLKDAIRVSQDELWFEKKKEWNLDENSDEDWDRILEMSKDRVRTLLTEGKDVIFDDISLKYHGRENLRKLADESGARPVLIYFDTPNDIREERRVKNLKTKERHDVPQHLIDWGNRELEIPRENEKAFIFRPEDTLEKWIAHLP